MVVAACDSSVRIDVRPYVTGAALSSLDSRGLFETEQAAAEPFDQITPCGISNVIMTSIEKETGKSISVPEAAVAFERIVSSNISDLRVDARQGP